MNKKNFDPFKNLKLDPYEQEIEDALVVKKLQRIPNWEKEKKRYEASAKYTLDLLKKNKKSKNVNLRIAEEDLNKLKTKAIKKGIPYQTLLTSLVHQYTTGQIQASL